MSGSAIGTEARKALLEAIVGDVQQVTVRHTRQMQAAGFEFPEAQSLVIGALMQELARIIACGQPPVHRGHIRVVTEELPRLVAASAVAISATGVGYDAKGRAA